MATIKFLHSPTQTSIKTPRLKFSNRPINFIKPPSPSSSSSSLHKSTPHSSKSLHFPLLASTNPSSNSSRSSSKSFDGREIVVRLGEALSLGFPIWVGSASLIALWRPPAFLWVGRNLQIVGLTLTMLGMGMTLTLDDLKAALLMPKQLVAGFVLQYTVMPLSGYFVSKLLKLPSYYAAGLILVACCPGGTASNVVTYLAKGNVALSVLMTAASTFTAAVMTPFLTSKLAGQFVAVEPTGLFISTVQVVLAPVLVGAALNQYCNDLVDIVSPLMPFIAVATVAVLCGSAIAQNASAILTSGFQVVVAVFALHGSGFLFGYLFSRMLGIDVSSSRTISIEVGMQETMELGLMYKRLKPHFLMILAQMGYTFLYFITEASFNRGMNPHVYITYRHIVGGIIMLPFAYFLERKLRPKLTWALFIEIFVLSLLGVSLTLNMYFASLKFTSPAFVSSMVNTIASLTFVIAVILRFEKLDVKSPRGMAKVLGTVISLAGVTTMTLYKGPKVKNLWEALIHIQGSAVHESWVKGSILTVVSCITWSIWYVMQNRVPSTATSRPNTKGLGRTSSPTFWSH